MNIYVSQKISVNLLVSKKRWTFTFIENKPQYRMSFSKKKKKEKKPQYRMWSFMGISPKYGKY